MAFIKKALLGAHQLPRRASPPRDVRAVMERVLKSRGRGLHQMPIPTRSINPPWNMGGDIMPMPPAAPQMPQHPFDFGGRPQAPRHPMDFGERPQIPQQPFDFGGGQTPPQHPFDMGGAQINPQVLALLQEMMQGMRPPRQRWEGSMRPGGVEGGMPEGYGQRYF